MQPTRNWLSYSLEKPGSWQDEPWEGDVVVKVGDKIFAFFGAVNENRVTSVGVKCGDRDSADLWIERYPQAVRKMSYIGKHGWNVFELDSEIPDDEIQEVIDASYEQVVAKLPKSKRPRTEPS
jgi:predicted DNA-binding protein (MmcQ/YjbR family)